MATAYYTCNLLPTGPIADCGYSAQWLGNYLANSAGSGRRDGISVHPMTCPYVTRLVEAADHLLRSCSDEDCLLVPGGCDAMRRMGDLMTATFPEQAFVLSIPRSSDERAARALASDFARMEEWLRARLRSTVGRERQRSDAVHPGVNYPSLPTQGGVFVVGGPLNNDSLLRLIEELGAKVAGLESCTAPDRWRPLWELQSTSPCADENSTGDPRPGSADHHRLVARQILAVGVCPRCSTTERRAHLSRRLDEAKPSSILYARQSFCDPGAYDALVVSSLAEERGLPYLEIEIGFPFEAAGPLRTRVEAFLEAQVLGDTPLDDDLFDDDPFEDGI